MKWLLFYLAADKIWWLRTKHLIIQLAEILEFMFYFSNTSRDTFTSIFPYSVGSAELMVYYNFFLW